MSYFGQIDYGVESTRGKTPYTVIHKLGRNAAIGTSFEPITQAGIYRTPQVSGATTLRVKAGNANDTAAGTGARQVTIQGLDATGAEVTEVLTTAGATASAVSSNTFIRLYRAWVSASGTYASATAGSHAADITIENSAGTEDWCLIDSNDFPAAQSEMGVYTIPLGKTGVVRLMHIHVEANKPLDISFFKREGVLETAPPYHAMRTVIYFDGIEGGTNLTALAPLGPYPAGTDIGFMAKVVSGSSSAAVDFEIWLYDS